MDLAKVLRQLHEELENLDAAILSLERLQESGRRRGRPPAMLAELRAASGEAGSRKGQLNSAEGSRK